MIRASSQVVQPQNGLVQHRQVQLAEDEVLPPGLVDQLRLPQLFQVVGQGLGGHAHRLGQLAGGDAALLQRGQDSAPVFVGQRRQDIGYRHEKLPPRQHLIQNLFKYMIAEGGHAVKRNFKIILNSLPAACGHAARGSTAMHT